MFNMQISFKNNDFLFLFNFLIFSISLFLYFLISLFLYFLLFDFLIFPSEFLSLFFFFNCFTTLKYYLWYIFFKLWITYSFKLIINFFQAPNMFYCSCDWDLSSCICVKCFRTGAQHNRGSNSKLNPFWERKTKPL